MKRAVHKEEIKNKVLTVALNLFIKQGYSKTTIKQIIDEAAITNGTLYHFFQNKEDILMHLVGDMIHMYADLSDSMVKKDDPFLRFALEIALQLYFIIKHESIGELYLESYNSSRISKLIAHNGAQRNKVLFKTIHSKYTDDDFYVRTLAVKGILHAFIHEFVHDKKMENQSRIHGILEMVLSIFNIPLAQIQRTIKTTLRIIKKQSIKMPGFEI
jgi:AcrR family transcriptional regulator